MKRFSPILSAAVFLAFIFFSQLPVLAQTELSPRTLDYQMEYFWDEAENDWASAGATINPNRIDPVYDYRGWIIELIVYNVETNELVRRTLIDYDQNGNRISEIYQTWKDHSWVNDRYDHFKRNNEGLIIELIRQFWSGDSWENYSRRHDYEYNTIGRVTRYAQQVWDDSQWIDEAEELWTWDGDRLLERINILEDGTNRYRFTYNYNDPEYYYDFVFQVWRNNQWNNRTFRISYFNDCGYVDVQVLQQWLIDSWKNDRKTEYFYTYQPGLKKVPICHNGHTIWVSSNAVPAHLAHGDCIGECTSDDHRGSNPGNGNKGTGKKKSLGTDDTHYPVVNNLAFNEMQNESIEIEIDRYLKELESTENTHFSNLSHGYIHVYPNPAAGSFLNIEIESDFDFNQLELIDLTGRTVVSKILFNEMITYFNISGIKKGIYYIKASGQGQLIRRVMIL